MKKTLTLVFAMLMLIMTVATACGGGNNTTDTTGPDTSVPGTSEPAITEKPWDEMTMAEQRATIDDELPEKDMDGYKFRFFAAAAIEHLTEIGFIEDSGDLVDTAVLNRNEKIQNRFNMVFEYVPIGNFDIEFEKITQTGDDIFELGIGRFTTYPSLAQQGFCYDWATELPYVDLEKPWYNQSAYDAISVDGHTYCMVGDLDLTVLRYTYCMFWNQQYAEDFKLPEDIYDVVEEGRWTYDYLLNLSNTYYTEDGTESISNDYLVIAGDPYSAVVNWQYAFDNPLYRQEDGVPVFSLDLEKQNDMIVKLNNLYWDSPGGYTKGWYAGVDNWVAGRLLAQTGMFFYYDDYREIGFDFTIIPYPKYDEEQTDYYAMSDGAHTAMAVPYSVKDVENASIIIEALNAESYKMVTPVYFETVLQSKYMQNDERTVKMLNRIYESVVFDFGYAYNSILNNVAFKITQFVEKNIDTVASSYDSVAEQNIIKSQMIIEEFRKVAASKQQ